MTMKSFENLLLMLVKSKK